MSEVQGNQTKFPINERAFLGTLGRLLKARNLTVAAEMLDTGKVSIEYDSYDNWNGGTDYWAIHIQVPVETYAKAVPTVGGDHLKQVIEEIAGCARELTANLPRDGIGCVSITPVIGADLRVVEGVNNQGRAHSENIAGMVADGLRFRSPAEINLYRALRKAGVTFAPLAVFLSGPRRIEPDFFIVKDAVAMVVEIDGATTHRETPVEADQRLTMFRHHGVKTERVAAADCDTEEKARATAAHLISLLGRYRGMN